jgi:hypothetical protein
MGILGEVDVCLWPKQLERHVVVGARRLLMFLPHAKPTLLSIHGDLRPHEFFPFYLTPRY